jgi:hypothetical protein
VCGSSRKAIAAVPIYTYVNKHRKTTGIVARVPTIRQASGNCYNLIHGSHIQRSKEINAWQPTTELTWQQVRAWRLQRHRLDERATEKDLIQVVGGICGLHAQLMSSAELSAWARIKHLDPDAVQSALWKDRSLVKTWAMRGTLHLLPAADFPLWQSALSTNASHSTRSRRSSRA